MGSSKSMGSSSVGAFCLVSLLSRESCRISLSILPYLYPQRNRQDTLSQDLCPETHRASCSVPYLCPQRKGLGRHPAISGRETFLRKLRKTLSNSSLEKFQHQFHSRTWAKTKGTDCVQQAFVVWWEKKGGKKPKSSQNRPGSGNSPRPFHSNVSEFREMQI